MTTRNKIHQLIAQFELNLDAYKRGNYNAYKRGNYNETQVRLEFIDPFFKELGWDVHNELGYAEAFKDVIHEDAIKVGGATKAPDYCFRIGGTRKFFLEAKKPSINIKDDVHPAYQLRRYAWSAKLPLSILTDFEEFAVYECRKRPAKTDKASTDRILYLTFREYAERWEELFVIFSKEAVLKGHFDRYVEKGAKRPTSEVDREFLKEIESWREQLAKNIALRNPQLGVRELNYAVQLTIDRIIFLRICEDRGIETYGQLQALCGGPRIYPRLLEIFYRADDKYNSGLFHFREEKGRHSHSDALTPALLLDDKVLKTILSRLYYPECPYEFSVMPAEILGNVYEQFLGKVIRLTAGHQAKIEEKPEVRKAGGVYYTPKYIVDYIVKQTVGKLCAGKTPRQIEKLRILDPACGSGSFLLGAFQYLLDYHRDYYETEIRESGFQKRHQRQIYQGRGGAWLLTTAEKKRILLNNIYGVDIDEQAVEVTKLSLLLKVLEYENQDTLERQLTLWRERALPDLGENIKCGNSLIGSDFYQGQQMNLFDAEEQRRINAFDWETEFPEIFPPLKGGRGDVGFDAVIGNPPYVRQEMLGNFKEYFQRHYKVYHGTADLYAYFIERGVNLLKPGGQFGYIVANKWMRANYGETLRRWLKEQRIEEIVDFGDLPVFQSATTYPCILRISQNKPQETFSAVQVETLEFRNLNDYVGENLYKVKQTDLIDTGWSLVPQSEKTLHDKIGRQGIHLEKFIDGKIYFGIKTGLNDAFIIDAVTRQRLIDQDSASISLIQVFPVGRDIERYVQPSSERFLILIPNGWTRLQSHNDSNPWKWFTNSYPAIAEHLKNFSEAAQKRTDQGEYWWELRPCSYYNEFEKPKIVYPSVAQRGRFALDTQGTYVDKTCYFIPSDDKYLLGLLNSTLLFFYYSQIAVQRRGRYFEYLSQYVKQFPIRPINFSDPADKARHDRMVTLVETMLDLHKRLQSAALPQEKTHLRRQITAADRQIDQLVYELYDLTPEEIQIVEKAGK